MEKERIIYVAEMAKLLNVSVQTMQRWDRVGILKAHRTASNRRYYTQEQYEQAKSGRKVN